MPKVFSREEYETAKSTAGDGEYRRMPAGGYVCAIQAVRSKGIGVDYVRDKQYVKLIWDVVDGEFAGKFSEDYWAGEDKDYGHQCYLSWKNPKAAERALVCIEESNPGFDAFAAFDADKWELFVGKKLGLVLGEEEYLANDGSVKTRFGFPRIKSVQDIKDGRFRVPELKKLEQEQQPAVDTYSDVPF